MSGSDSGSGVIFVDSFSQSLDLDTARQTRASSSADSLSKAVSSNITNILESLLKDYDKTERPSYQNGEPTKVNVNILIRSMGPISEMQMVRLLVIVKKSLNSPFSITPWIATFDNIGEIRDLASKDSRITQTISS